MGCLSRRMGASCIYDAAATCRVKTLFVAVALYRACGTVHVCCPGILLFARALLTALAFVKGAAAHTHRLRHSISSADRGQSPHFARAHVKEDMCLLPAGFPADAPSHPTTAWHSTCCCAWCCCCFFWALGAPVSGHPLGSTWVVLAPVPWHSLHRFPAVVWWPRGFLGQQHVRTAVACSSTGKQQQQQHG